MEFVDRIEETKRLKRALEGERPAFVAVYGRRRLGKSTLLKRVLTESDIYFMADRSEANLQRRLLADVIAETIPDFNRVVYPDWEILLRSLNNRLPQRFSLCLDEFPYLVEQAPELPSVIQKLIDNRILAYNLVICGSSQHMMYDLLLNSASPLYGRAHTILKLSPIKLLYISEALHLGAVDAIEEYSVWGGVPRYWELREAYPSFKEAIYENVLSVNGTLYEEPVKLFQDDIKDIVKTSTIMSYIGAGANRLSEIAARCGEPATNLSRPLRKLIDLGFLYRDVPFGTDEKNAKKSLYKIADPFLSFYYKFVVTNRSFIELDRKLPVEQDLNEHFQEFVGMHWEHLCRDYVTGNEIDGIIYGEARRWWGSVLNEKGEPEQIELDIVAESLDGKYLFVGECKWTGNEDEKRLLTDLHRKADLLPYTRNHQIVTKLFLKTAAPGSAAITPAQLAIRAATH